MARNGVVATSQPLAAQAGLDILKKGGNAVDAAVATAAMLSVVEPMNVGPAGDMFAIVYIAKENKLYALNASGKAPSGATVARMKKLGYVWNPSNWGPGSGMPDGGILAVTVPGAVWGWDEVQRRFGSLTFKETLQPAIDYAEQGFPISERIAHDWELPKGLADAPSDPRKCCTQVDPDSIATWYIDGKQPVAGQIHRNPGLAKTFRILQQQGRDGFYKGEIAQAIVDKSSRHGGTMTLEDLASYSGEWTTPATTNYHGYDVFTLPPPAQTWAAEEILNILEVCVPKWTARADIGLARSRESEVLAPVRRGQETRVQRSVRLQCGSEFLEGAAGAAPLESTRRVVVRQGRSESRVRDEGGRQREERRRHHRAVDCRSLRQHGGVGQQPLRRFRLWPHRPGLRPHTAQPRRLVHARSEEPQCDRAAQASVQHAVCRLRHAQRQAADDRDA